MKRIINLVLAGSLLFSVTSCFGEFALVRKVYDWNEDVVDNKFAQTLLFYGLNIIPVYGIAGAVDFYILNLIEFWSGSNPMAMAPGEMEEGQMSIDGEDYTVIASQNRFDIKDSEGALVKSVVFSPETNTWSKVEDATETPLVQYISIDGSDEALVFEDGEAVASFNLAKQYTRKEVSIKLHEASLSACK